jgi:polo-like kinase 4
MPKFSLAKEVTQPDKENNQWLANQIFKKLGLDQTSPLKLRDVKPCKIQTKNGYFQIGEDGTFQMEISNKDLIFNISEDGKTVTWLYQFRLT